MNVRFCVECGQELRPDAKFCPNCGTVMTTDRADDPHELIPPPAPPPALEDRLSAATLPTIADSMPPPGVAPAAAISDSTPPAVAPVSRTGTPALPEMRRGVATPSPVAAPGPAPVASGLLPRGLPLPPLGFANFGERLVAYLVDLAVIAVPLALVGALLFPWGLALSFILGVGYYVWGVSFASGQTLGARLMDIRVVRVGGSPVAPGLALIRTLVSQVSTFMLWGTFGGLATLGVLGSVLSPLSLIGYLMMLWTARCQTLHDKLSRTEVWRIHLPAARRHSPSPGRDASLKP